MTEKREKFGLENFWNSGKDLPRDDACSLFTKVFLDSVVQMLRLPITSMGTILCIAVAVFFLTIAILLNSQLQAHLKVVESGSSIIAFLSEQVTKDEREDIEEIIKKSAYVSEIDFQSKEDNFRSLASTIDQYVDILEGFSEAKNNPLPASLTIKLSKNLFHQEKDAIGWLRTYIKDLSALDAVDQVILNENLVNNLIFAEQEIFVAGITLITVGVLILTIVVFSASTLAFLQKRMEVQILSLLGAMPNRVKAPFLMKALLEGLMGGLLGVAAGAVIWLVVVFKSVNLVYLSSFVIDREFLSPVVILGVFFLTVSLSLASCFLALKIEEKGDSY